VLRGITSTFEGGSLVRTVLLREKEENETLEKGAVRGRKIRVEGSIVRRALGKLRSGDPLKASRDSPEMSGHELFVGGWTTSIQKEEGNRSGSRGGVSLLERVEPRALPFQSNHVN